MILMNDFKAEPAALRAGDGCGGARACSRSGWYILGKEVEAFEQAVGAASAALRHCRGRRQRHGCDRAGTARAGHRPGRRGHHHADDRIRDGARRSCAPARSRCWPTSTPTLACCRRPACARCLSARARSAVVLVHLYGQCATWMPWTALCRRSRHPPDRGLRAVAPARWQRPRGRQLRSGRRATASIRPRISAPSATAARWSPARSRWRSASRRLRNYGQSERYVHPELGMNSRLDELQAATARRRDSSWLERFTARRRADRAPTRGHPPTRACGCWRRRASRRARPPPVRRAERRPRRAAAKHLRRAACRR